MLPQTLFIPLINSHYDDTTLRYALRSWSAHSDITTVLIIGHKPKWYTGDHIPYYKLQSKTEDIFYKTQAAASVLSTFIFSNDDIFLLQPLTELPYYYQGELSTFRGGSETFMRYVHNTASICPGGMYFDVHTPYVIDSKRMLSLKYSRDTILKSIYCYGTQGVPYKDCKINHHMRTEEINQRLSSRFMFSLGDNGMSSDMRKWLAARYSEPSPWELA